MKTTITLITLTLTLLTLTKTHPTQQHTQQPIKTQTQTQTTKETKTNPTEQETQPQTPQPQTNPDQTCHILIQDNNPNNTIILNNQGQWINNTKTYTITLTQDYTTNQTTQTLTTTNWNGPYKPTNPQTQTWTIKEIKTINQQQFQNYIDQLQQNPTLQTQPE